MKQTVLALTIIAILACGCQQNSAADPVVSEERGHFTKAVTTPGCEELILSGVVSGFDGADDVGFEIFGSVRYTLKNTDNDPDQKVIAKGFLLSIHTQADIRSVLNDNFSFKVSGSSTDRVVFRKTAVRLEKTYSYQEERSQITLHIEFSVTPVQLSIGRMWLTREYFQDRAGG